MPAIAIAIIQIIDWWKCTYRNNKARTELTKMSDRDLRDIGISREQIFYDIK